MDHPDQDHETEIQSILFDDPGMKGDRCVLQC
jgi:hypothetical protein